MKSNQPRPDKYIEAGLDIPFEHHDAVCNFIIENCTDGLILYEEENGKIIGIKFYLPLDHGYEFKNILTEYIRQLESMNDFSIDDIRTAVIKSQEWVEEYRRSVKPTIINGIVVRPPWADIDTSGKLEIIIKPRMAFGTGSHESTKLCMLEMLKYSEPGWSLLDLGCGSGILAILGAKLGAGRVKGVDINLEAIHNANENCRINEVADKVEILHGSIELMEDDPPYDMVTANLLITIFEDLLDKIMDVVRPCGIIILSGFVLEDEKHGKLLLTREDIERYEINRNGQWLSFTVFKK